MRNRCFKFIIAAAAIVLLTGCNTAQVEQPPVLQNGTPGTNTTTSVVTTVPTTVPTTTVPATVTTVPTKQPTAPSTVPSTATTVPAVTTAPSSTEGTVPTTTVTTKQCNHIWTIVPGNDPTCTEQGRSYEFCPKCLTQGKTIAISPLGHNWGEWYTVSEATCVANRKEAHKCERCGAEQTRTVTGSKDPTAHNWEMTYDDPSDYYGAGWTAYKCTRCKEENIVDKEPWTQEQKDAFCREVEALIIEQLNAYRITEGTAPATHLPGMQQVAIYRAWQVKDKELAHDWDQLTEACTVYKYGLPCYDVTVDETTGAYIQGELNGTYIINGLEALDRVSGMFGNTAEELSRVIASGLYESKDHWNYLGDAEFPYIAAGITFEPMVGWSCCVLVSSDNHDLQNNA